MNGPEKLTVVRSTFWRMLYGSSLMGVMAAGMCAPATAQFLGMRSDYGFLIAVAVLILPFTAAIWILFHLFLPYKVVFTFDPESRMVTIRSCTLKNLRNPDIRTIRWDDVLTVVADVDWVKLVLKDSEVVFVRSFNLIRKVEALRERIATMLGLDRGDEK